MTGHLNEQAALRWHTGEASDAERAHVSGCVACQAQLEPLGEAVHAFAAAAREWSDAKAAAAQQWRDMESFAVHEPGEANTAAAQRPRRSIAIAWAAACILLSLIFSFGLPRWQARRAAPEAAADRQQTQRQITQDDALLEAVDQDVSQLVPSALTPLFGSAGGSSSQSPQ